MPQPQELREPELPAVSPAANAAPAVGLERSWRTSLIAAGGLALALGVLALVWLFASALAQIFIAVVIGEALRPASDRLGRLMPRPLAVVVTYLVLVLVLGGAFWFVLSPLIRQLQDLLVQLPELGVRVARWLQRQDEWISAAPIVDTVIAQLQRLGGQLVQVPFILVSSLLDVVLVIFLSLYWLLSSPGLHRFTLSLFPPPQRNEVSVVLGEMGRATGGYVRGVGFNILIVAVLNYLGLLWIGLPFPLVFGLMAGLFEIIPIVGSIMSGAIIVVFALTQSWTTALIVLVFVLVVQQIEGNILTPWVMGSQTDIDPLLVLIALTLGGAVGGMLGAIVSIPLAGELRVLVVRVIAPAVRRWSGAPEPETGKQDRKTRSRRGAD